MKSSETSRLTVGELEVSLRRKAIRNIHLSVHPPEGSVRLSVPLGTSDDAVRLAIIKKLDWIRRQQARFAAQARQSEREMVNGESHYFLGRRYRLVIIEGGRPIGVVIRGAATMELRVLPGSDRRKREAALAAWYRRELKAVLAPLIERWRTLIGVEVSAFAIRRMRTRWGSCTRTGARLTFNLELAKKPPACLEFVVVHELCHLVEGGHGTRFIALMDRHLPDWRSRRALLNAAPLAHEDWDF